MVYLLDTDHLSIIQLERSQEHATLTRRLALRARDDVGFSVASLQEQVLGVHTYLTRARTSAALVRGYAMLDRVLRTTQILPVVPFDVAAGAAFDGLQSQNLRVGTMDLRIAAIALSRDLTLLTRNISDFGKITNLRTEDWTR